MKIDRTAKIRIDNPIGFSEKISKKKPPQILAKIPEFFLGSSKKFMRITEIKTKFRTIPFILKWTKKLVWSKAKI